MINFEPCIRNFKSNGYAKVYIRVIKVKEVQYISTPFTVTGYSGSKRPPSPDEIDHLSPDENDQVSPDEVDHLI